MTLRLDVVTLGVPDVGSARELYTDVLTPSAVVNHETFVDLDLHGHGHLGLLGDHELAATAGTEPPGPGFRGYAVSYVLDQPAEVRRLEQTAREHGATVLKPVKKGLFGGFAGYLQSPDGAVWSLAAERRKDSAPPSFPARPSEAGLILGVADPVAWREFYGQLGMTADRDYGSTFVGLAPSTDGWRLSAMPRRALAKDAGVDDTATGFSGLVLHHRAGSREEVDTIVAAMSAAGGGVAMPPQPAEWGGYTAHVADPDGFIWQIGTPT